MKKQILTTLLLMLISSKCLAQDGAIIGYIKDSLFHPLVCFADGRLTAAPDTNKSMIPSWVKNVFHATDLRFNLSDPVKYINYYGVDTTGYYGKVAPSTPDESGNYYANLETPLKYLELQNREQIIFSFYQFFSEDKWGRHFIPKKLLDQTIDEISKQSNVVVHYITDLDSDSKYELWISYKVLYGKSGNMIYEQTGKTGWDSISNQCFMCD